MHRDKAALAYHGRSQLATTFERLERVVDRCYVSVRADQTDEPLRKGFAQIVDAEGPGGPINGILAAQQRHPQAAWAVLACDLPFLDRASLTHLLPCTSPPRPRRCGASWRRAGVAHASFSSRTKRGWSSR